MVSSSEVCRSILVEWHPPLARKSSLFRRSSLMSGRVYVLEYSPSLPRQSSEMVKRLKINVDLILSHCRVFFLTKKEITTPHHPHTPHRTTPHHTTTHHTTPHHIAHHTEHHTTQHHATPHTTPHHTTPHTVTWFKPEHLLQ